MRRLNLNLNLTAIIVLTAVGVLLPVMLATAVGIVALVIADDVGGIVTGVLVISFAVTAAGCALLAVVLTSRKARLARRQADFVANISHELRTPLSAIRLYAQTLQSGSVADDPEQIARCLATILRETEWLDVMIDQVLAWRASSRDMLTLDMQTRSVTDAVSQAVERFRAMSAPDELTLVTAMESSLPVEHDNRALNAVVLNLLTNAAKYTGADKQIKVSVRDEDAAVVIEVEDNGMGLTAAEARHIFQPFYRAQRHDGSDVGGVGLGLAIARHLVQRHGGTLTVSSEKGRGSAFTVFLPAAAAGGRS
ncbi:MAG: HAMP domain-containing sensor histidine kinase [Kiritimatiellia bacterium]|jgi:two-component system phosphate regulon sensor histidine kinase PhoR|nr:HAMP domain-containing sensor histidine kinase [Kiritimatiellia bacterium]MDP6629971.1 HAMP domain-containing sensor histidine kinase [Kiritimatiellia bacterium]MDP6810169.1 HAMP domain-containing sensor histidine kinase [Kiritimatiellia bacterium]MDP7023613.1 HAMP domain-containing sensor histidine kinase [Kiritimatiellia bacterium]